MTPPPPPPPPKYDSNHIEIIVMLHSKLRISIFRYSMNVMLR
jgi:hypothetical protein